jgi:hypothetical protein
MHGLLHAGYTVQATAVVVLAGGGQVPSLFAATPTDAYVPLTSGKHDPPTQALPVPHWALEVHTHSPSWHVGVDPGQINGDPQPPQLLESVCSSTQVEPQRTVPPTQPQVPFMHDSKEGHGVVVGG